MATEKKVETKNEPVAETPQKKKSNTVLIIVIVLVIVLFVLPAIGFGLTWFFVGSKITSFVKKADKGQVEVSVGGNKVNVNTNQGQQWPTTAPAVVPKFSAGKITTSVKIGDSWTVTATNLTENDYVRYINDLAAANFTMGEEANINGLRSITGTKDGWKVGVTYTPTEGSSGNTILIGITKAD